MFVFSRCRQANRNLWVNLRPLPSTASGRRLLVKKDGSNSISYDSTTAARIFPRASLATTSINVVEQQSSEPVVDEKLASYYNRQIEAKLFHADHFVKLYGRIEVSDFTAILQLLRDAAAMAAPVNANQALLILRLCGSLMPDEKPAKRTEKLEQVWKLLEDRGVKFDISHYNAILLGFNENRHTYDPTEFLEILEKRGVEPNRVTYQHFIENFCQNGDIEGAKAILEFMKEKKMPVNEYVFNSLITGHCKVGDFESAKSMMTIMKDSGLEAGSDSHMAYILGLAEAKDVPWSKVMDAIEEAKASDVSFTDHHFFELMIKCAESGRKEEAKEVLKLLPKKAGYFHEMRNAIPSLIYAGETDLPVILFQNFSKENPATNERGRARADFLVRSLIRSEMLTPDEIINIISTLMESAKGTAQVLTSSVIMCLDEEALEIGKAFVKAAADQGIALERKVIEDYIIKKSKLIKTKDDMLNFFSHLIHMGVAPSMKSLAENIMPLLMKGVGDVREIRNNVPSGYRYSEILNAAIQYYLNRQTRGGFRDSLIVLRSLYPHFMRPHYWRSALAKAYLATDEIDLYIGAILLSLKQRDLDTIPAREGVFESLPSIHMFSLRFKPDKNPDDVLRTVLEALDTRDIGITENVCELLKTRIQDPNLCELMDSLVEKYKKFPEVWTLEKQDSYFDELLGKRGGADRPQQRNSRRSSDLSYDALHEKLRTLRPETFAEVIDSFRKIIKETPYIPTPKTIHTLTYNIPSEKIPIMADFIHFLLENRPELNILCSTIQNICNILSCTEGAEAVMKFLNPIDKNRIMDKGNYGLRNMSAFLLTELEGESREKLKEYFVEKGYLDDGSSLEFDVSPFQINKRVEFFIEQNEVDKAVDLLISAVKTGEIYGKSLITVLKTFAKDGNLSKMKDFLSNIPQEKVAFGQTTFGPVINELIENQNDVEAAEDFLQFLTEEGFITKDGYTWSYNQIRFLIEKEEYDKAIELTKEMLSEKRPAFCPYLMKVFSNLDDVERLQKVLDVYITGVGETNALYDLVRVFLEADKNLQAKKLLETPGLQFYKNKIDAIWKFLLEKQDLTALENFVAYSKSIYGCDRNYLYGKLIDAFEDNGDKISEIWISMQEEGLVPTEELKVKIARYLEKHGKYVPFEVPKSEEDEEVKPRKKKVRSSLINSNISDLIYQLKSGTGDEYFGSVESLFKMKSRDLRDLYVATHRKLSPRNLVKVYLALLYQGQNDILTRKPSSEELISLSKAFLGRINDISLAKTLYEKAKAAEADPGLYYGIYSTLIRLATDDAEAIEYFRESPADGVQINYLSFSALKKLAKTEGLTEDEQEKINSCLSERIIRKAGQDKPDS